MNRTGILFTLLALLVFLPVVFTQQGNDRQTISPEYLRQKVKDKAYEEALPLLQTAIQTAKQTSNWPAFDSLATDLASCWGGLERHDSACVFLENAVKTLTDAGQKERSETATLYNHLAYNYLNLEQYVATLNAYEQAIGIFERKGTLGPKLAYAYKNAAQILVRWDNHTLAKQYFEAAIRVDTGRYFYAATYGQLANESHYVDDEDAVMQYFRLGMAEPKRDAANTANLQAAGSTAFIARQDYLSASEMLHSALIFYKTNPKIWSANILGCLTSLADISARQHNFRSAESYFQEAETEGLKYYPGKHRELAKLFVETGQFYEANNRLEQALDFYQKALVQTFPDFNSLSFTDNPPIEEAGIESQALRAAAAKARVLLKKTALDEHTRLNAAYSFDLSFAVAAKMRRTYGDDVDKLALASNNREAYTAAALNLWQLWRETNQAEYLARLFAFFEQTKAQALGDALQQQRALALADIPDSLMVMEKKLRLDAASTASVLKEKEWIRDSTAISQWKLRRLMSEKAYSDFLKKLKDLYPQFDQFEQAGLTAELSSIRTALPDSTAILSFFDAGDRYLCLVARRSELTAYEVLRDSAFNQHLSGFLSLLADKAAQEKAPSAYFAEAFALGHQLLPAEATAGLNHLIIVPDGQICYLPFEALLTAPHTGNFATAPYLLRTHTLQYAWSASLLALATDSHLTAAEGFLQIAPFAKTTRNNLPVLPNSLRDKPDNLSATVLVGEEASVAGFLQNASDYEVLHLSTHASAGNSGQPGIELFDRTLTLSELYAQRFHASLVSLSACETGAGKLTEGEGVLSLARAFAYAGAKSLVASQWTVNERSTSIIFAVFYENLKKGLPKSEALRQTKLAFLASDEMDTRKAPYHWAAFMLTGADGKVAFGKPWWKQWPLLVGGLALMAFGVWFYGKRKK